MYGKIWLKLQSPNGSPPILEDHAFLNSLVNLFQLFNVWFVGVHSLLVLLQPVELIFQGTLQGRKYHLSMCGYINIFIVNDDWSSYNDQLHKAIIWKYTP